MEDEKLREIFAGFNPPLSSSRHFMSELQKKMETVDLLRQQNAALRRHNRMAVAIAAVCGFVTGVVMTLALPALTAWLLTLSLSLTWLTAADMASAASVLTWLMVAAASVITALSAYDIAMARLSRPSPDRM